MDLAYEACAAGTSVETYVRNCRAKQNYRVRMYANGVGFPPGHERKVAHRCYPVINAHTGTPVLSRTAEPEFDRWYHHHQRKLAGAPVRG